MFHSGGQQQDRSLQRKGKMSTQEFDFIVVGAGSALMVEWLGSVEHRAEATQRVRDRWSRLHDDSDRPRRSDVLFGPDGNLQTTVFERLLKDRNDRPVYIEE